MPSREAPEGDHRGDHRQVPEHRGDVGDEEPAVAVQDPQGPGRDHQCGDHGEEDSKEGNQESLLVRVPSEVEDAGDDRRQENPEECEAPRCDGEDPQGRPREPACVLLPALLQVLGVYGDHGGAQRALAQEGLDQIRGLESRSPGIRRARAPEVEREYGVPDESGNAAKKNSRAHPEGGAGPIPLVRSGGLSLPIHRVATLRLQPDVRPGGCGGTGFLRPVAPHLR